MSLYGENDKLALSWNVAKVTAKETVRRVGGSNGGASKIEVTEKLEFRPLFRRFTLVLIRHTFIDWTTLWKSGRDKPHFIT